MLRYLLDEHISPAVARQLHQKQSQIPVETLHAWNGGEFVGESDRTVLVAADRARLTLVTYDQATIPEILLEWAHLGIAHSGVVFVSQRTIPPNNFGLLIRALASFWEKHHRQQWRDRVGYLTASL